MLSHIMGDNFLGFILNIHFVDKLFRIYEASNKFVD